MELQLRHLLSILQTACNPGEANVSGARMQGLAALGLDPAESRAVLPLRARLRSRAREAAPDVNPGLLGALLNSLVGIISEPVRQASQA